MVSTPPPLYASSLIIALSICGGAVAVSCPTAIFPEVKETFDLTKVRKENSFILGMELPER